MLAVTVVIDYRHFRDWALLFYGGACALLLFVVSPLGSKSNGAQSWFQLGPFQLQPSEFAKLGLILAIANVASQFYGEIDRRRLFVLLAVAGLPLLFIMLQPDLGTALVLLGDHRGRAAHRRRAGEAPRGARARRRARRDA